MRRNLSGIHFREKIDGKWENVCFEDLSEKKQDEIMATKEPIFVKNLAKMLGRTIKEIGDKFNIIVDEIDENI